MGGRHSPRPTERWDQYVRPALLRLLDELGLEYVCDIVLVGPRVRWTDGRGRSARALFYPSGLVGLEVMVTKEQAVSVIAGLENNDERNEDDMTIDDLKNRFSYHEPKGDQADRYEKIRATAAHFAMTVDELCPDSREKSLAMTKLEECVMWANASIARNDTVK